MLKDLMNPMWMSSDINTSINTKCLLPLSERIYHALVFLCRHKVGPNPLVDPGGAAGARPPQQDQFLSFLHMFSLKSVRVGGWHPPMGQHPPNGKSWICHCNLPVDSLHTIVLCKYVHSTMM